jgi:hypothetical protein
VSALDYLTLLLALAVGWYGGWIAGHTTVATECERLGGFYVGSTVYQCKLKESAQ